MSLDAENLSSKPLQQGDEGCGLSALKPGLHSTQSASKATHAKFVMSHSVMRLARPASTQEATAKCKKIGSQVIKKTNQLVKSRNCRKQRFIHKNGKKI